MWNCLYKAHTPARRAARNLLIIPRRGRARITAPLLPQTRRRILRRLGVPARTHIKGGAGLRLFISAAAWAAYLIGTYCFAHDHVQAMTMTFLVLSVSQLAHALNQRSNTDSVFKRGQGHNPYLFGAMAVSLAIVLLVALVPPLQGFFKLTDLTWQEWLVSIALSLFPLLAVEVYKLVGRIAARRKRRAQVRARLAA